MSGTSGRRHNTAGGPAGALKAGGEQTRGWSAAWRRMVSAMGRSVALGEVWLRIEGAALLRGVVEDDDEFVATRLAAIRILADQLG